MSRGRTMGRARMSARAGSRHRHRRTHRQRGGAGSAVKIVPPAVQPGSVNGIHATMGNLIQQRGEQRGGYSQYQNNLPMTPTYSVGGVLPASQLGLANPPPIQVLSNCAECRDNYNHFNNRSFPSKGH